jgi:hypothetical protein
MRPIGTAFFVSVPLDDSDQTGPLIVTALHVLAAARSVERGDGAIYVRINTPDGGSDWAKTDLDEWATPEQSPLAVDVAVCAWRWGRDVYDYKAVHRYSWLTDEIIERENINVGDDLFLTGLFVNHYGRERNVPIVRMGNIATMPGELVQTKLGPVRAYLIESRSVGGLSGSPVFISMGMWHYNKEQQIMQRSGGNAWYLLGVMHGHWDAVGMSEAVIDDGLSTEYINMGIAIVTPIQEIVKLLDDEKISRPLAITTKRLEAERMEKYP